MNLSLHYGNRNYLLACFFMAILPYLEPVLFPMSITGSVGWVIFGHAVLVLACYAAIELFRASRDKVRRALIAVLLILPHAGLLLASLWDLLRAH